MQSAIKGVPKQPHDHPDGGKDRVEKEGEDNPCVHPGKHQCQAHPTFFNPTQKIREDQSAQKEQRGNGPKQRCCSCVATLPTQQTYTGQSHRNRDAEAPKLGAGGLFLHKMLPKTF